MLFETLLQAHNSLIFISWLSFFFLIRNFSLVSLPLKDLALICVCSLQFPRQIREGLHLILGTETMRSKQLCRPLGSSASPRARACSVSGKCCPDVWRSSWIGLCDCCQKDADFLGAGQPWERKHTCPRRMDLEGRRCMEREAGGDGVASAKSLLPADIVGLVRSPLKLPNSASCLQGVLSTMPYSFSFQLTRIFTMTVQLTIDRCQFR